MSGIDRTNYNALVNDDGSNTVGSPWNKAAIKNVLLDPIDAASAADIAAAVALVAGYGCVAYHNTTQSVSTASATALSMNAEDTDTPGMHSTSVNTSRVTIPSGGDGLFRVTGTVNFPANATGQRQAQILKNGSPVAYAISPSQSGTYPTLMQVHYTGAAVATDYFEVAAYQDSGGSLSVGSATRSLACSLAVVRV